MTDKDFSPAFIVHSSSVRYQYTIAHDYATAALEFYGNNDHMHSYHYLASTAIELYIKTIEASNVCVEYKDHDSSHITQDQIIDTVKTRLGNYSHNLKKLIDAMPKVKKDLDIVEILKIPDPAVTAFIDEWRILFNDDTGFSIKTLEGVRYGSFSKQPNVAIWIHSDQAIHDFLLRLDDYVIAEMEEAKDDLLFRK